jgi:hypothetical protein
MYYREYRGENIEVLTFSLSEIVILVLGYFSDASLIGQNLFIKN